MTYSQLRRLLSGIAVVLLISSAANRSTTYGHCEDFDVEVEGAR
jgi:hypothetical protein